MTPDEIQRMMALQMALSQQPQAPMQNSAADPRAEMLAARQQQPTGAPLGAPLGAPAPQAEAPPPLVTAIPASMPAPSGNPLLVGNDALRQQFAEHPELAPPDAAQWLDQREQHILGNDAPPAPPPMLPDMPAAAPNPPPQSLPQAPAPQPSPPMLPQAPAAPPPMMPPPPSAPMLPPGPTPAQITPFPQAAPVMSQVSPAPKVDAQTHVDNSVQEPTRTFNPAYQPPPLPQFLNASLVPNLGGYKPAPTIPGYGQPRSGGPFTAHPAASAPQLPSFDNPFGGPQFSGAGGLTAGGPSYSAGINDQQPYDQSLFARFMMPGQISPQF